MEKEMKNNDLNQEKADVINKDMESMERELNEDLNEETYNNTEKEKTCCLPSLKEMLYKKKKSVAPTPDDKTNLIETKEPKYKVVLYLFTSVILGFLFGFILEKSKVYDPKNIRQQLIFQNFIMMKMFFSALGTSALSILIMNLFFKKRYTPVFESYRTMLKGKSFLSLISGGLILGCGMQISGACPGMIFVQMGAGVNYSYLALIGGIIGALVHGLLSKYLSKGPDSEKLVSTTFFEFQCLNKVKHIHYLIRVLFIVFCYLFVGLLEIFLPYTRDYTYKNKNSPFFHVISEMWLPEIAGLFLGSLQFISLLIVKKSLGASTSYSTFVSYFFPNTLLEKLPYLKKLRCGKVNFSGILFVLSIVLGSFTSSYISGVFAEAKIVHPYNAILGGFLLVFGARLASGCNTGHGISGTSHLFIGSFAAMVSMFAGGIALAFYSYTDSFFL